MRLFFLNLGLFFLLSSCSNEGSSSSESISKDSVIESAQMDTVRDVSIVDIPAPEEDQPVADTGILAAGRYPFTLHWISWDRPGSVVISRSNNGWRKITGRQNGKGSDFVSIDGEIRALDPLQLQFRGKIIEKVSSINNGDTCVREGEQTFLSTKNRKYWRLQNMTNCEGGMLVDYIDIYFRK